MRFLTLLPLLCLVTACAVPPPSAGRPADAGQLQQLQSRQDELSRQVGELQETLLQMQERLQAQQLILSRLPQGAAAPQIVTPGSQTTAGALATAPALTESVSRPGGPSATELYLKAFSDLASGRFNEAENGFRVFIERYPDNDFAGNAQFWLGECYYSQRLLTRSAHEFELVADNYPEAPKAADALSRMVDIYRELNLGDLAESAEQRLLDSYPQSSAARRMRERH